MGNIETGVDRLVELINREKKISIDDAAKKLGVSKVVVQEWADFLEEEKIISIEYMFSKTFLVERKLTNEEIKEKQKAFSSEKDGFIRKVETSLKNLEQQSLGLEKIKTEFENIKKSIGGELEKVKNELKELEKYEYLKKNIDKEIEKQVQEFHEILDKSHKEIEIEQKKHQNLLEELEIEKRELEVREHRLLGLEEKEKELIEKTKQLFELVKEVDKKIGEEKTSISASSNRVLDLKKAVKDIEKLIKSKKDTIQPLIEKAKKHEAQILKLQQDILEKAQKKTASIDSKVAEGTKAISHFQNFFDKKAEVEELINETEKEKKELFESFKTLEKKALALDLASKSNNASSNIKILEKELENVNKKKEKFKADLEKLIKIVKG